MGSPCPRQKKRWGQGNVGQEQCNSAWSMPLKCKQRRGSLCTVCALHARSLLELILFSNANHNLPRAYLTPPKHILRINSMNHATMHGCACLGHIQMANSDMWTSTLVTHNTVSVVNIFSRAGGSLLPKKKTQGSPLGTALWSGNVAPMLIVVHRLLVQVHMSSLHQ